MIHPLANQKEQVLPACFASYSFDLRDVNFNVCPVTHDDVIHANKKDIDLIFKLSGSGIHRTTSGSNHVIYNELLIKAMTLSERKKWIDLLTKIHKQLKHPSYLSPPYQIYEAYDPNLILIKNLTSAATLSMSRLVLGTDDGLYALDIVKDEILQ